MDSVQLFMNLSKKNIHKMIILNTLGKKKIKILQKNNFLVSRNM